MIRAAFFIIKVLKDFKDLKEQSRASGGLFKNVRIQSKTSPMLWNASTFGSGSPFHQYQYA